MNCFSDLGSCCWRPVTRSRQSAEAEDILSRPPGTGGGVGARRRRRLSGGRSVAGAGSHWRPELTAIKEDFVAPADDRRSDRFGKKSGGKRRGSMDRSNSFSHAEEYFHRPNPMSMTMPMFAPSPFMF